jgi:hypothetical protein
MQPSSRKGNENRMSPARRWSGLYTVGLMLLLLVFFVYHQWTRSGFFTSSFGYAEMVALYFPILFSMLAPIVRAIQGRDEIARQVDVVSDICLVLGSLWLLIRFPFDFAHLADVLPSAIQFALAWLNDSIGRIILILQIIIAFISALSGIVTNLRERSRSASSTNTLSG